jgi:hypothetical protein
MRNNMTAARSLYDISSFVCLPIKIMRMDINNNNNNSIKFFIYLRAELNSRRPITESARNIENKQ